MKVMTRPTRHPHIDQLDSEPNAEVRRRGGVGKGEAEVSPMEGGRGGGESERGRRKQIEDGGREEEAEVSRGGGEGGGTQ